MTVLLEELTIRYGTQVAVDRASATFPSGAVGLLGRNGAGKSSILRALLGLVQPASGRMQILDLPPDLPATEVRRRVGYMPETDGYVPGLNGFETVVLAGRMTGLPRGDAARRAHEVLYLVGLDEQRYRSVAGYSAGMRQKVKLAVALVHDPDVLFLDEPTNGLDPAGREEMLDLVRYLAQDLGKSVVLSSHILPDVERMCSYVVLLEKGRVLAAGPIEELTAHGEEFFDVLVAGVPDAATVLSDAGLRVVAHLKQGAIRVALPEGVRDPELLFGAVYEAGGHLRRLQRHRRSLEEVFLGTVGGTDRGETL